MNRVARQSAALSFLLPTIFTLKFCGIKKSVILQKILGSYYYTINENLYNLR